MSKFRVAGSRLLKENSLIIYESELEKAIEHSFVLQNMLVWYKDTQSKYRYCGELHAKLAGVDSERQMIGKNDYSFCWRNKAEEYQSTDQLVIQGKINYYSVLEKVKSSCGELSMLVTKYQVLNKNRKCIGVAGINVDVSGYSLVKRIGVFDKKKNTLEVDGHFGKFHLTKREISVLKLLMLGYTNKKIGLTLNISHRTVEGYINILKDKLHCDSKNDVVTVAINNGLSYLVVDSLNH